MNCRYNFISLPHLHTRRIANNHCWMMKSLLADAKRVQVLRYEVLQEMNSLFDRRVIPVETPLSLYPVEIKLTFYVNKSQVRRERV